VLKLLDPPAGLQAISLGNGGEVRKGQFVLCLSNAFTPGFRPGGDVTVDQGLVSNLRRKLDPKANLSELDLHKVTLHHYGTLIQTDARTTPGCSGGALLDLDGKVIGLTTALAGVRGDQPGGFAIPLDESTRRIIEVLERGEEVEYGFLGVTLDTTRGGVRLYRITPGSPAARAGLMSGDRILSINGHPIQQQEDLFLYIGITLAGNTARIQVAPRHFGDPGRTVSVKLAKYYVPGPVIASKRPPAKFGLRVDHTSILAQRNPFAGWGRMMMAPVEGVVVREVESGSPADQARLQPDKVITRVNGKLVTSPAEYYQEMARAGNRVELTYLDSMHRPIPIVLETK
jgi:S1-C subfamily serine protease